MTCVEAADGEWTAERTGEDDGFGAGEVVGIEAGFTGTTIEEPAPTDAGEAAGGNGRGVPLPVEQEEDVGSGGFAEVAVFAEEKGLVEAATAGVIEGHEVGGVGGGFQANQGTAGVAGPR